MCYIIIAIGRNRLYVSELWEFAFVNRETKIVYVNIFGKGMLCLVKDYNLKHRTSITRKEFKVFSNIPKLLALFYVSYPISSFQQDYVCIKMGTIYQQHMVPLSKTRLGSDLITLLSYYVFSFLQGIIVASPYSFPYCLLSTLAARMNESDMWVQDDFN